MMMMMIKFLLLTLLVISPISVRAEKELMKNECHNAEVPTICMECLESDPTSVDADRVGIAGIIIQCLDSRLDIITNKIMNLLSTEAEGVVKTILEACKKELSTEATTKLSEANKSLQNSHYDETAQSIKLALDFPLSCRANLQGAKFRALELFSQINIYAQLSDAAMKIIDRF